ncbi:hypothetical protein LUZ63_006177 [Rhynchospora breviuscula]|uniref:Uncharacterized protein n=1 Tax=Rhynchospora breviuscula TaxID=2022672 RepID=A0A9Q0HTU4_9POAL|nr:hypothetical protein LUZ63_006177 [Rhynchospora breviuscula]
MGKVNQNLNLEDKALKGARNVVKLLPTGTAYAFQFLAPLPTNRGHCHTYNKVFTIFLLLICSFVCFFSSFTDSYVGIDKKLHYGIATWTGLWPLFDKNASALEFSSYKLKVRDFVHSFLALAVLISSSCCASTDTVSCFCPSMLNSRRVLLKILPTVVGVLSSACVHGFPQQKAWHRVPTKQGQRRLPKLMTRI